MSLEFVFRRPFKMSKQLEERKHEVTVFIVPSMSISGKR